MQFNLTAFILNPLVLLFFTMVLGNLFGQINFRKVNCKMKLNSKN